ncbi:DUF4377 domain-containing protein [Photobacterium damselae]|uniref:DUF4377 domain-containing protein n=1 Tax=Photobacterium damselae TaxID=38293 RepID=UPI001EDD51F3|nr:DUF4377 domain-containing protein [Photobacterium damselae]MCG3812321.1 DUF4377 domain-containing protein [Photobacterium damselae]
MKFFSVVFFSVLFALFFLVSCSSDRQSKTMEVTVGPQKTDCFGITPMKCLVVNEQLFYDSIDGFDFEPGYAYRLKIERTLAYPNGDVPADASIYHYKLIKILEKSAFQPQ